MPYKVVSNEKLNPEVMKLIDALAREDARRDHEAARRNFKADDDGAAK